MRKRNLFLILILMVIGFASVSLTLYINGTINAKFLEEDYDIKFTKAEIEGNDELKPEIGGDGQTITFFTPNLSYIGDKATLKFEITNSSTQYNANVEMDCSFENAEYTSSYDFNYDYPEHIEAGETLEGYVEIEITESIVKTATDEFVCKLDAHAEGRELKEDEEENIIE
ncbi:MAG: hypothetical protein J1F35_02475 [Erysipelotrichales bacterium]|nr:hypothetical protein [Erysipelotrichales bacterium]